MQQHNATVREAVLDFSLAAVLALAVGATTGAAAIALVWLLALLGS
jgi:hypothetical protein